MCSDGSVTHWFDELRRGNSVAAQALWERYFPELVRLAQKKLRGLPRRAADEEDVAASAMESFFQAAQAGRFPNLADRDDLWRLLIRMTARKVVDLRRRETRRCRGGGRVRAASEVPSPGSDSGPPDLAEIIGRAPTPELAAIMAEECRRLLGQLAEADLRTLAVAKMEGYTNREIAERLDCSVRTVERRLQLIRKKWQRGDAR